MTGWLLFADQKLCRNAAGVTVCEKFIPYLYNALSNGNVKRYFRDTSNFGMRHLTYGTNFLHLFAFLVSRPPQSALLHCHLPGSDSAPKSVVGVSHGVFHSRLKTHLLSRSSPRNLPLSNGVISQFLSSTCIRKYLALKTLVSVAD